MSHTPHDPEDSQMQCLFRALERDFPAPPPGFLEQLREASLSEFLAHRPGATVVEQKPTEPHSTEPLPLVQGAPAASPISSDASGPLANTPAFAAPAPLVRGIRSGTSGNWQRFGFRMSLMGSVAALLLLGLRLDPAASGGPDLAQVVDQSAAWYRNPVTFVVADTQGQLLPTADGTWEVQYGLFDRETRLAYRLPVAPDVPTTSEYALTTTSMDDKLFAVLSEGEAERMQRLNRGLAMDAYVTTDDYTRINTLHKEASGALAGATALEQESLPYRAKEQAPPRAMAPRRMASQTNADSLAPLLMEEQLAEQKTKSTALADRPVGEVTRAEKKISQAAVPRPGAAQTDFESGSRSIVLAPKDNRTATEFTEGPPTSRARGSALPKALPGIVGQRTDLKTAELKTPELQAANPRETVPAPPGPPAPAIAGQTAKTPTPAQPADSLSVADPSQKNLRSVTEPRPSENWARKPPTLGDVAGTHPGSNGFGREQELRKYSGTLLTDQPELFDVATEGEGRFDAATLEGATPPQALAFFDNLGIRDEAVVQKLLKSKPRYQTRELSRGYLVYQETIPDANGQPIEFKATVEAGSNRLVEVINQRQELDAITLSGRVLAEHHARSSEPSNSYYADFLAGGLGGGAEVQRERMGASDLRTADGGVSSGNAIAGRGDKSYSSRFAVPPDLSLGVNLQRGNSVVPFNAPRQIPPTQALQQTIAGAALNLDTVALGVKVANSGSLGNTAGNSQNPSRIVGDVIWTNGSTALRRGTESEWDDLSDGTTENFWSITSGDSLRTEPAGDNYIAVQLQNSTSVILTPGTQTQFYAAEQIQLQQGRVEVVVPPQVTMEVLSPTSALMNYAGKGVNYNYNFSKPTLKNDQGRTSVLLFGSEVSTEAARQLGNSDYGLQMLGRQTATKLKQTAPQTTPLSVTIPGSPAGLRYWLEADVQGLVPQTEEPTWATHFRKTQLPSLVKARTPAKSVGGATGKVLLPAATEPAAAPAAPVPEATPSPAKPD